MATYKIVNADQLDADLTAIGNAIRTKGGTTESLAFPSGMVEAIGAISTGVELNFEVVGNPQPSSPKENTIWVNTDVDITGWYFSATQPEDLAEGEVWFSTGTASPVEFNALKKNGIQICPLSAKQYVSNKWVDCPAKICINGTFVDVVADIYIFKDSKLDGISGFNCSRGTVEISDIILFESYTNDYGLWYSKEQIDVTDINSIEITLDGTDNRSYISGNSPLLGVSKSTPTNSNGAIGNLAAYTTILDTTITGGFLSGNIPSGTYKVNVSGITGFVYLVFSATGTTDTKGTLCVSEIKLCI